MKNPMGLDTQREPRKKKMAYLPRFWVKEPGQIQKTDFRGKTPPLIS